jgi:urease gamma subunit
MLEFETNTLAFMTAALEQSCKKLKNDTPEARKYIADKLMASARTGRVGQIALTEAGEQAVAELDNTDGKKAGWRALLPWMA